MRCTLSRSTAPHRGHLRSTTQNAEPASATTRRGASPSRAILPNNTMTTRCTKFCCTRWPTHSLAPRQRTAPTGAESPEKLAMLAPALTLARWHTNMQNGSAPAQQGTPTTASGARQGRPHARCALERFRLFTQSSGSLAERTAPKGAGRILRCCHISAASDESERRVK